MPDNIIQPTLYGGALNWAFPEYFFWAIEQQERDLNMKCRCGKPVDYTYQPGGRDWGVCRKCARSCSCGSTPCVEFVRIKPWKADGTCRECGVVYCPGLEVQNHVAGCFFSGP